MTAKDAKTPSNLMRLRERLAEAGKDFGRTAAGNPDNSAEELERLNDLCVKTKGTPAYPMAQARALLLMKEMERP